MPSLRRLCLPLVSLPAALAWSVPAGADAPLLRILPESELRFGRFAVPTRGSIVVSPTGAVTRNGIISVSPGDTSPARFTLRYDRGNNGSKVLQLRIRLVFSAPGGVTQGGVTASLSALQSDLPNYPTIAPNQILEVVIPNCRQRICERRFTVGGRLDVDRRFGGASVAIPIPVNAFLVSVT